MKITSLLFIILASVTCFAQTNSWTSVDKLVQEQKFQAAFEETKKILLQAQSSKNEKLWTEALVKATQLQMGLSGFETAVRFLKEEKWPQSSQSRALLHLYYSESLINYHRQYQWEIRQREKTVTSNTIDLKAWTTEQIAIEIRKGFDSSMGESSALALPIPDFYQPYMQKGSYPKEVKPFLRDFLVDLAVQHLSDTSFWTPEQTNEIYRLDLRKMMKARKQARLPSASQRHPLEIISSWLTEHLEFHQKSGYPSASLESHYKLISTLYSNATDDSDKEFIKQELKELQSRSKKNPWWSRGQAILAEYVKLEKASDSLVRALAIAEAGALAYPKSIGGQQCEVIIHGIKRPTYEVQSMQLDGIDKESIVLNYKNIQQIYFRAYPVDVEKLLSNYKGHNHYGYQGYDELRKLYRTEPVAQWSLTLKPTKDFRMHRTLIKPKLSQPGYYLIFSSSQSDFSGTNDEIKAVPILISNIVMLNQAHSDGGLQVQILKGDKGETASGVQVTHYQFDYDRKAEIVKQMMTDDTGRAQFTEPMRIPGRYRQSFLVAKQGNHYAFNLHPLYFTKVGPSNPIKASMIFTDRSIYRPGQKIMWKIVAYSGKESEYSVAPKNIELSVALKDPNNQVVTTVKVNTNDYGTASGEFVVPAGRPLGHWQITSNYQGISQIRIEEYKRPTFEVELLEPKQALRLNKKAIIQGKANYYFGQPVTSGKISYRITRQEVYPWWWQYSFWSYRSSSFGRAAQSLGSGQATLSENGSFQIEFKPEIDERRAKSEPGVTYNYNVQVDLTDEGGETRSASRSYRIGFVSVEADLNFDKSFYLANTPIELNSHLRQLDGKNREGLGQYRIVKLNQPTQAPLPVDLPRESGHETFEEEVSDLWSEDKKRARFETQFTWQKIVSQWSDGEEITKGVLNHDSSGKAKISFSSPKQAGAYRIYYETKDDFGSIFKVNRDFVVASDQTKLSIPLVALAEKNTVLVGEKARVFIHSGLTDQTVTYEIFRSGQMLERKKLKSGQLSVLEIPIGEKDRGGFSVLVYALRDYQMMQTRADIFVPWDNKNLHLEFSTFRDKLRPGAKETFRISVKNPKKQAIAAGQAEVLALMYDRSLDLFVPHHLQTFNFLYPNRLGVKTYTETLGVHQASLVAGHFPYGPSSPSLFNGRMQTYSNYSIGGPGARHGGYFMKSRRGEVMESDGAQLADKKVSNLAASAPAGSAVREKAEGKSAEIQEPMEAEKTQESGLRSKFSETAFFKPHLLVDKAGTVSFEFEVPDSVTSWKVMAQAITKDLMSGVIQNQTQTIKELMIRPYIPRFLREGDRADIRVVINNSSTQKMSGVLDFEIQDESGKSVLKEFGLSLDVVKKNFSVEANGSITLSYPIIVPKKIGVYAFKVIGKASQLSDGELRPFPVLPSRMHLAQSRFVTLKNKTSKIVEFKDLASATDPTLISEKMVVTVDGQLFFNVLQSLPYLINYPYDCSEQTLNRFLSTGILSSLYGKYPSIAQMAKEFSSRKSKYEKFDEPDANRRMTLEESPWLQQAQGGKQDQDLINALDEKIVKSERDRAIQRLKKMQHSSGAFPWFEGGKPNDYMTLYVLMGFARALEFKVDVPKDVAQKAWSYVRTWLDRDLQWMIHHKCCWETVTLVNYVLSSYPDTSWTGDLFDDNYRKKLLDYSFTYWRKHSPLLKGYLSLTLKRMNRAEDGKLVWDSVMDSSKTNAEQGTFWAPEDRAWLWYNDTIETHAFSLRTLMELSPNDHRNEGLVQWLFLNKKLNHWKSTKATAEVIYSLAKYLDSTSGLGQREVINADLGTQSIQYVFEPDKYTGRKNQTVIPGDKLTTKNAKITFQKETPGFAFASAVWHFSTEKMPEAGSSDFFSVSRKYFLREHKGKEWVLKPLIEGSKIKVGDQIEVQISLRTKHEAQYVHLRDPRAAGLEPESQVSSHKWDLGIEWYEEIRDSGSNFFFSRLPVGEYTFKYRLRANMAGNFRIGPATVQSMYAPEFNAYSAGNFMNIEN